MCLELAVRVVVAERGVDMGGGMVRWRWSYDAADDRPTIH